MPSQDLKFLISQYLDGTLPAHRRAQVEELLKVDPTARRFLQEEMRLDGILNKLSAESPQPNVDWNSLAMRMRAAVAAVEANGPARLALSGRGIAGAAAALAACLLITTLIVLRTRHTKAPPLPIATPAAAVVIGPQAEPPRGQPQLAQVTLAAPSPDDQSLSALLPNDRPSHVYISSATPH